MTLPDHFRVRSDLASADLDAVIRLHIEVYCEGLGYNDNFNDHVEPQLRAWAASRTDRDRIWLADRDGELVGCVAVVQEDDTTARLRWFVVRPSERGKGVGRWLLAEAIAFARGVGYTSMMLWTVNTLTTAAKLYTDAGFRLVEETPGGWLPGMIEQRYEMALG